MGKDQLAEALPAYRSALCDQLDGLVDEQWNQPSLCGGWRVRDVLGHLVSLQEVPQRKFVIGVVGMSGFHRRVDSYARSFGERDPADLIASYRQFLNATKGVPFLGLIAPVTDVAVHALDIERPLGLDGLAQTDADRAVLSALAKPLPFFTSKKIVRGLRFEATDIDWSAGDGALVSGRSGDLILAMMGRRIESNALTGDGVADLLARSGSAG